MFYYSVSLLWVVLEKVLGHELDWVLWSLLGALRHGLKQDWNHSLVKVGSQWEVGLALVVSHISWGGCLGVLLGL